MSKIARAAVLLTALASLSGMLASGAGAVTWHNSGNTAFTATSASIWGSSTGVVLSCTSAAATGTVVGATPFVGVTWSAMSGTFVGGGCSLVGITTTIDCRYTLTAASWLSGSPANTYGTYDLTCGVYQFSTKICHLGGTADGRYQDPYGNFNGTLDFNSGAGSSFRTSNGTAGTCPLGNGDALNGFNAGLLHISGASGGTGTRGPVITRTA